MRIQGCPGGLDGGATAEAFQDHRVAMTLMVAGLASRAAVSVTGRANVETSFPGFASFMAMLGARIETNE